MPGDDLQSCAYGKANAADEWVFEANAIDVAAGCAPDNFARFLIAAEETIEHRGRDLGVWTNFFRRRRAFCLRGRLNKAADKPSGKPSRSDALDRITGFAFERSRNGIEVELVGDGEMFQALANAPGAGSRLPIQLLERELRRQAFCPLIVCFELTN